MTDIEADKKGSLRVSERVSEQAALQQAFASDPKYKKYTQQVEKCLNSFDNVHEWADCIAFLKQLLKTFQSYMQFKEIPRKLIVAKRLSQCLNPALPTGVHQRALDVYAHILAVLGSEGLKRDLPLWSSGLFPFFEYASTSVKPTLLNLYDTHYLPLQTSLRPIMKSFILALLPGLEEETGEFFEKVLNLLDRLSGTVSLAFFFQNVWLIMLTTPSARGTSLNFLLRRLPQLTAHEQDIATIVGRDFGLMIRAFSAALEDENLLVRRGALDLLLQFMRVDSETIRRAQPDDRTILMRAAVSVVLRRDLSLNRRLYTWLLGPDEKSEQQIAYLKTNSLQLLRNTLKEDMMSPSGEYPESRPFKIFISLLDKWEIGAPLTEVLAYDIFSAAKGLIQAGDADDVTMTMSTLYEAIEPQILWTSLLSALHSEICGGDGTQTEAIRMVQFILNTFSQDEEIQTIHLPIVFPAIVDLVTMQIRQDISKLSSAAVRESLLLLEAMLKQIPQIALTQRPELSQKFQAASATLSAYRFACTFYGKDMAFPLPPSSSTSVTPFGSSFENLLLLSASFSRILSISSSDNLVALREGLSRSLVLLHRLVERITSPIVVTWPSKWFSTVIDTIGHQSSNFNLVDRIVTLAVTLHQSTWLEPGLSINDRSILQTMVKGLLSYLRIDSSIYHARAVNLIWTLDTATMATKHAHVESIIAQIMSSSLGTSAQEKSFEAFGVLWRLTEDNLLPGFRFKVPMVIVLDTLNSDDPALRCIGETWMRCNLKSYLRVLDPIMFDLMDPLIRRVPSVLKVGGRELQGFSYERPFNHRYINHLLDMLLSIIRFGGQGFSKTARGTSVRRSYHSGLIQRIEQAGLPNPDPSYLDTLLECLLRFLQSEPQQLLLATMDTANTLIQSTVVDLLQTIASRGEIDALSVQAIEAAVIGKLYYCVHTGRLNLQNKLLHLLHSLISAFRVNVDLNSRPLHAEEQGLESGNGADEAFGGRYPVNPLLIHSLVDGISTSTNRPVLQHWLDFVLMAIPQFQPMLQTVVAPLNDCICRQLQLILAEVLRARSADGEFSQDLNTTATDAEFNMLLNGLERLILLSLAYTTEETPNDDELGGLEKTPLENTGILGYVSNVFGSDNTQQTVEQLTVRSPGYRALHEGVRVLYSLWGSFSWSEPDSRLSVDDSLALIYTRTRMRSRRVLEHLFRVHPSEVFESVVECWDRDLLDTHVSSDSAFELVDVLIANVQSAVHLICESISCRISTSSRKQVINPDLNETVLFAFLEQYLCRLEGPLALQVWSRFLQLVKDIIGGARDSKTYNFPLLRCLTVLAEKITQTTAMEDRRIRKDVQENFGKLLDACVAYVSRSFDSGSWIRRTTEKALVTNGRDSPAPRSDVKLDEKLNTSNASLVLETPRPGGVSIEIKQINDFIAVSALPNLRRFLLDNDKIQGACTNIVYYVAAPVMKGRSSRPLEIEDSVVSIIREMSRIPVALKAWKTPVAELFNDNKLFACSPSVAESWIPIVRALFDLDKAAFPELLGKITTTPSANIFTSREYEMLLRSLALRRLSFVLFTGEKNHFLTQLPSIQEKLVDMLKNVSSAVVLSEVYLCIRVLLYRISPHNLTSFWPVLLTELYRVFEQTIATLPSDGSEDLQLILSASKCLDLLLALQTDDFQIHQWIFITDTVDAIYRPNEWYPAALLDQLAEIAGRLPTSSADTEPQSPGAQQTSLGRRPMRRPMLSNIRQIDSIRDLVSFFSSISISSYENVYASGGLIDLEAVEKGLMDDMFEGR